MIRLTPNLRACLVLFVLSMMLQGCGGPGYWKNDEISKGKRGDMHQLNDKAIDLIKKGDTENLGGLLSKELINDASTDARVKNMGHALVRDSFTRFDEYYIVNKYLGKDTLKSGLKNANAYSLIYPAEAEKMYFALFVQAKKDLPNKQMVTLAYAKYSYGWKICFMDLKPYSFNGKNAQQLLEAAQKNYAAGQLIDALNNSTLATTCARPNAVWLYDNEPKIYAFYNEMRAAANKTYKFPMHIDAVPSRPEIIGFDNKITREGNFPIISYQTRLKLADTAALNKESRQLHSLIGKLMPGIDKNNRYIYYKAYNQVATEDRYPAYYDMVGKCW